MSYPFFSVIIPVYNAADYLHQCVSSVLAQSFQDFEVILIDDGSTDRSGAICDEYVTRDARVRVFHQVNRGVSASRNSGISNAKGRYINFIDSDDFIETNRLKTLYETTDKTETDIVVSDFETFDSRSMQTIERMHFSSTTILKDFIAGNWAVVWRLCIGRQCLQGLSFLETISYGEDYLFACQALCSARSIQYAQAQNNSAYKYRKNVSSSLMRRQKIANIAEQCMATENLEIFLEEQGLLNHEMKKTLNKRKNWCRTLLFNEACTIFEMKPHAILLIEKKIYRFFLRKVFVETKE